MLIATFCSFYQIALTKWPEIRTYKPIKMYLNFFFKPVVFLQFVYFSEILFTTSFNVFINFFQLFMKAEQAL